MRVLTFQTEDVIQTVLEDGVYYADKQFSRERRDYKLDIEQLNGYHPIWCYAPVSDQPFKREDFLDGALFHRFKCEMSLRGNLSQFPMIELEVADDMLKLGLTHNAYLGAKVFSHIDKSMLKAIYRMSFIDHWYFPRVFVEKQYAEDILFKDGLQTKDSD